ncbi:MAG: hypothetical protein KME49_32690 [Brasilonema octagenarum HA4186-MV1]|jgi:hypothetical protein|nr:hypothetical protein [Brasilonema octagenarum HA4186-MV1]
MVFYQQLELFDVRAYASKQPTAIEQFASVGVEETQFDEVPQSIKYKQLELDLFPQASNSRKIEFVKLAA